MKGNSPAGINDVSLAGLYGSSRDLWKAGVDLACRGYCEYFKDDGGGERECAGFTTFLHSIGSGKVHQGHLACLLNLVPGAPRRVGRLMDVLCFRCSYRKDGCDFMAETPVEGSTPCGGYRLFQALLDTEALCLWELPDLSTGLSTPVDKCDPYLTLFT